MKKAVMYGAGNIGRGFIGKVFSDSGYEVCFLDIDEKVIEAFNKEHEYKVKIVTDDQEKIENVRNVYAMNANIDEAIKAITECDIMATAVGVNILLYIIKNIANGVKARVKQGGAPLNVILAENQIDVDKMMHGWIYNELNEKEQAWADSNLGLVEASIGRMVPPLSLEEKANDPLLIAVEPYAELPVDSLAFKGGIPDLVGLKPFTPFSFYIKRKLFLHNMGHAICAYLGWEKGYEYISDAIRDDDIHKVVSAAMSETVAALAKEYKDIPFEEIEANRIDLLQRFRNTALKDTVARVAGDPMRKLRSNDRLVGAALYCIEQNVGCDTIVAGIVSALKYDNRNDIKAMELQGLISLHGIDYVMDNCLGLTGSEPLKMKIKKARY